MEIVIYTRHALHTKIVRVGSVCPCLEYISPVRSMCVSMWTGNSVLRRKCEAVTNYGLTESGFHQSIARHALLTNQASRKRYLGDCVM